MILVAINGSQKMLSKKAQVSSNRLKPKPFKDPKYLSWLHAQGLCCFSCGGYNKIELHHVKQFSSDHKDDRQVIPLCGEECHRNGMKLSPHGTPKAWRKIYPMQMQLDYAEMLYSKYKESICTN